MPEQDNHDVVEDDIYSQVHAYDEFLDFGIFFGGYPRVNTALDDIHFGRAGLEIDKMLDDASAGRSRIRREAD